MQEIQGKKEGKEGPCATNQEEGGEELCLPFQSNCIYLKIGKYSRMPGMGIKLLQEVLNLGTDHIHLSSSSLHSSKYLVLTNSCWTTKIVLKCKNLCYTEI